MNILQKFIQSRAIDKKEHLMLGVITGFPLMLLAYFIGGLELANYAGALAMIIYAAKEIVHDKLLGKGKMEFLDWFWTSLPVIELLIFINII